MKCFDILKETVLISMMHLTNQIVFVCGMLMNFQSALVSTSIPVDGSDADVDDYFKNISDCSSEASDAEDT